MDVVLLSPLQFSLTVAFHLIFVSINVGLARLLVLVEALEWIAAEVGRQSWIIYRVMKTEDAVTRSLSGGQTLSSIVLFGLLYSLLGILYLYIVIREVN